MNSDKVSRLTTLTSEVTDETPGQIGAVVISQLIAKYGELHGL